VREGAKTIRGATLISPYLVQQAKNIERNVRRYAARLTQRNESTK
jgi:hypothetical protein